MIFWNISKSFQKKNLRGGCQQAVRTTVWNYNRQSYRFCIHWAVRNHSVESINYSIWGRTGCLNTLTLMVQLAKNYTIAFSKFLKSLLPISNIADLRQWMESSNVNEVTRAVLNSLLFFTKRFRTQQNTKTPRQKHKNGDKRISDFFPLRCFYARFLFLFACVRVCA